MVLSGYQFLCGGIILTAAGLICGGRVNLTGVSLGGWVLLLYMGFISAAAYTLWGILLKYNPVGRVAVYGFMNPMFSFLLSALLLGEGIDGPDQGLAQLLFVQAALRIEDVLLNRSY